VAGLENVIGVGPGDIAQAHTVDEWITVNGLNRSVDLLRRFLDTLP